MTRRVPAGRLAGAVLLSLVLLATGVLLALAAQRPELIHPPRWVWLAFIPVYVIASQLNLAFERRDSNAGVTLVQMPLALGIVLIDPLSHLVARLGASLLLSAGRRSRPLQVAFNTAVAAVEVGVAAAVVTVGLPYGDGPGPRLWTALLVGLLLSELVSCVSVNLLFRLLALPVTRAQLLEHLVVAVVTSAVFTGLAIVTIAAVWTDTTTAVVVGLLALALAAAYRGHRRVQAQQRATEDLYAFVKDLGPVDVHDAHALDALQRVRQLLHAEHLELAVLDGAGGVTRHLTVHREAEPEVRLAADGAAPLVRRDVRGDCMRSPLVVGSTVVGLLTVTQRIGSERGFDMRDLRLMETVATELATALDRGRLLLELSRAATIDALTELPNLRRLTRDLDALLASSPPGLVLAAVSVDSFREVNDALGPRIGDALLREVARRLEQVHSDALVGRIGGCRFAVAVPADPAACDAGLLGLDLRTRLEGDVDLGSVGTSVRVSVGCARAPEHGHTARTLLCRAETAMYSAQRSHGGPVLWEPAYEVQGQRRLAVVMALREALHSGAVGAAYQPKVDAGTGACSGVEALARWVHPALGELAPDEFVPLAEAAGLMGLLTNSVLRQALMACGSWQQSGRPVGVAVNVSASTLQDRTFVTDVAHILASVGVPADLLTLELTEDVVVADPQLAAERMHELRALGVNLSVDDFGTGYSSLTYLKGLPIDQVKIDKCFVAGLVADPGDQAVVRAVVDIAHTLGLEVVAEGVEQEEQHVVLRRLGVDQVQGYLHAHPMPAVDMARWLAARADQPSPTPRRR
ncbi:MAG: EAL domain-containing protein [Actinomycetota bacterium]|nr:EAL domain-containing protein [Actinomycetota bacterium]